MKLKTLFALLSAAWAPRYAVTPGAENPQIPSVTSEVFLPDQLVAGRFPIISAQSALISGAAALQRGTVLGQVTIGAAVVSAGVRATGTITFSGIPAAADTLTVQGTAITFKAAGTIVSGNQIAVESTLDDTVSKVLAFLNASADANIALMTYSAVGDVITATSKIGSTTGNAYTLAKSSTVIAVSGATLAGGTANTGNGTCVIDATTPVRPSALVGAYTAVCTVAGTNSATFEVKDPRGRVLQELLLSGSGATVTFNDEIKFALTDGGTDFAVGDAFTIAVAAGSGVYKKSIPSAVDGSQVPSAILGDYSDPSSGNVYGAVYLAGEFNGRALIYDPGFTIGDLKTLLRPFAIYVRDSLPATGTVTNY